MLQSNEEKMSRLRATYLSRLEKDFETLYDRTHHAVVWADIENIKQYMHKVAGSGGSFGFANLSALCKAAEHIADDLLNHQVKSDHGSAALPSLKIKNLQRILDDIRGEILRITTQPQVELPHTKTPKKETPDTEHGPERVWILDDDAQLANRLAEQLTSFGFAVSTFYRFADLVDAQQEQLPSFLIADVNLGDEGDFYQLCKQSNFAFPGSELVVVSSFDDFDNRIQAVRHKALTFIQKPVDANKLANLLRERAATSSAPKERVLLVDDDEELAQFYKLSLESAHMVVKTLSNPENVLECIQEFQPELILIDLYMPEYDGMEVAALIRQYDALASIPIVYLSSEHNTNTQALALAKGGDDFLTKPIDEHALQVSVKARVHRARQLHKMIHRDSLTGLLKHSTIKEAVEQERLRAQRTQSPLTIAMLDIDFFKKVNDNYGHSVGDTVIASLATLLTQRLRQTDAIGRYGGEEFLVVLPNCDSTNAERVLNDIRTRFSAITFVSGKENFHCTLSAGYTVIEPKEMREIRSEAAIETADSALYQAKHNGRNRVEAKK